MPLRPRTLWQDDTLGESAMWLQDWGSMLWGGAAVPVLGPLGLLLLGALLGGAAVLYPRVASRATTTLTVLAIAVVPLIALAVSLPHSFVNGTVADADEVNANFEALAYRSIPRATGLGPIDGTDSGALASRVLNVTKDRNDTALRVLYSDSFRTISNSGSGSCRWEIRFDGASCPGGALVYDLFVPSNGPVPYNIIRFSSAAGYCEGLSAGPHTVQIYVGDTPGFSNSDCFTGWNDQRWTIEAEEVL